MFSPEQRSFLSKFFPLFLCGYVLVHALPLEFVNQGIASLQTQALHSFGMEASAKGSLIATPHLDFRIIIDCSGIVMSLLFASLVLATNVKRKNRALALGIPALLVLNQLRLFATMLVGMQFGTGALDTAHFALWFFDGLLVLALWFAALEEKERGPKRRASA